MMPQKDNVDTNEFFLPSGSTGVLLVHGFSGSPPEMRGLGDYLFNHGYTVLGVRLAGHGTTPEDMEKSSLKDWILSAEEGLHRLMTHCDTVYAAGHSTGGLICLKLSLTAPLKGVVSLSPPMFKPSLQWFILPLLRHFMRWYVIGGGTDPSAFRPPYTVWAYPKVPTKSLEEFWHIVAEIRKIAPQIQVPTLIMQGRNDRLIPQTSGPELLERLGSRDKRLVWVKNSAHMLTLDSEREEVWKAVQQFIMDPIRYLEDEAVPSL